MSSTYTFLPSKPGSPSSILQILGNHTLNNTTKLLALYLKLLCFFIKSITNNGVLYIIPRLLGGGFCSLSWRWVLGRR